ncbi:MAG TPA: CoA transferase [bacterium]|nr:CoA transferase [bacterium]
MSNALDGIKVLDLSQFLSGPRCSQLLAMKGADVVKVEPPEGEAMRLLTRFMRSERMMSTIHQNKQGIVVDMKKEEGRALIRELSAEADVLVENFAPGLMKKLGLDYELLSRDNPRLVYVSISGFGRTGPYADRLAFDIVAQATGGVMSAYKMEDRTPKIYFADLISGAYAALGAVEALFHRERTGRGGLVDVSMLDVIYFQYFSAFSDRSLKPVADEIESLVGRSITNLLSDDAHPLPFWSSFRASDGYVVIVALTDREWRNFMEVIGRPELAVDARFCNFLTRVQNAQEGIDIIKPWVAARKAGEVVELLESRSVPCAPVLDFEGVNAHPQLRERGMLDVVHDPQLGDIGVPGDPIRLDGCDSGAAAPCPHLGEHTRQVLERWLAMDDEQISALRAARVIN